MLTMDRALRALNRYLTQYDMKSAAYYTARYFDVCIQAGYEVWYADEQSFKYKYELTRRMVENRMCGSKMFLPSMPVNPVARDLYASELFTRRL